MAGPGARAAEPLYIVIMHNHSAADTVFRTWIKNHRIQGATVAGSRMLLHDQHSFDQFRVTWSGSVANITVWDTWLKRHIYLD